MKAAAGDQVLLSAPRREHNLLLTKGVDVDYFYSYIYLLDALLLPPRSSVHTVPDLEKVSYLSAVHVT